MKTVKLGPFKGGINNVAPEHKLPDDQSRGIYHLRDAVNVDITNTGTLKRRAGFSKVYNGADLTTAWSDDKTGYVVDAGVLKRLTPDATGGLLTTEIANAVGADLSRGCSFVSTPLGLLVSDGFDIYRLSGSTLGVFTHEPRHYIASAAAGDKVFLVTTTRTVNGVESAPGVQTRLEGDYPISIEVPASSLGEVTIYISAPNGTEMYRYKMPDTTITLIQGDQGLKDAVITTGLVPMVAGSRMQHAFGRLWAVQNNVVFFSEPYRLNMMNPTSGFIQLESTVNVFHPNNNGFVVGTETEVGFISTGDPNQFTYRTLAPYGAVSGTDTIDFDNNVFFMTPRGLVKVNQDATFVPVHEGKVMVDRATAGASGIIERDGLSNVVSSLFRPELSRTAASSFMDAEIVRKETYL